MSQSTLVWLGPLGGERVGVSNEKVLECECGDIVNVETFFLSFELVRDGRLHVRLVEHALGSPSLTFDLTVNWQIQT